MGIIIRRIIFTCTTLFLIFMSFGFSNQSGAASGRLSKGLIAKTAQTEYFDDISYRDKAETIKDSDLYVRKAAHFTEYALLGVSLYFFFGAWFPCSRKKPYVLTLIACAIYASADELHQTFSAGRTPAVADVAIDFAGCAFSCAVILLIRLIISRRGKKKENIAQ